VSALSGKLPNGDTLAALVNFANGTNLQIGAILATPFDGRFTVYGTRGWIEIRDKTHPEDPTGWTVVRQLTGREREVEDYPAASSVRNNLDAFAQAAAGGPAYPVPQRQMIDNIAALEAIFKSVESGAPVTVER
jgi:predicted dehydrogenase